MTDPTPVQPPLPVDPQFTIPVGLATRLGLLATALMGVLSAGTTVLNGDHKTETIGLLAGAVITFVQVLAGRYNQAAAIHGRNR